MQSLARDLNFPQTREEFVAGRLREAILRGDLVPGEKLDENALAEILGVSRTPIRSALRVLAAENLVELHPHRGAIVGVLSPDELQEIYMVRGVLEGTAARLAAPHIDDARLAALETILEEMDETTDPDHWLVLNNRFHTTIYQAANRPRLLSIIEYVRNISAPYIRQFIARPDHTRSSREDHQRMLEACRRRDGLLVEQEVKKHLEDVAKANVDFVEMVANGTS
ncbi:MAG TPA: GntR family transcriptional regulator [Anaerolineae bacterium]|nr:GntR family transcriptional regulator [Anaerolineae bacterium]